MQPLSASSSIAKDIVITDRIIKLL